MQRVILGIVACLCVALSGATVYAHEAADTQLITIEKSPFEEAIFYFTKHPTSDARQNDQPTAELEIWFFHISEDIRPIGVAWENLNIAIGKTLNGMAISYTRHGSPQRYSSDQFLDTVTLFVPQKGDGETWSKRAKAHKAEYENLFKKERDRIQERIASMEVRKNRLRAIKEGNHILVFPYRHSYRIRTY